MIITPGGFLGITMSRNRVHDIKVELTLFLFFVACFLAFMYAKEKETHHARFTGPA